LKRSAPLPSDRNLKTAEDRDAKENKNIELD